MKRLHIQPITDKFSNKPISKSVLVITWLRGVTDKNVSYREGVKWGLTVLGFMMSLFAV